jgi:hypothetical protein
VITDNCSSNTAVHVTSVCGERKGVRRAWQFTRCRAVEVHVPQAMSPQLEHTQMHVHHSGNGARPLTSPPLPRVAVKKAHVVLLLLPFPRTPIAQFMVPAPTDRLPNLHHPSQCLALSSALKMEAGGASQMIVPTYLTT